MKSVVRVISLFMVVIFLQLNICSAVIFKNREKYENFPDVIGTKYEDAALYLKAFGYISGYPDGTFRPEKNITRAELVRIAFEFSLDAKNAFTKLKGNVDNFKDVGKDHWAKDYIEVAAKVGMVSGYEDGTFRPDNLVTHSEALTILLNVHGLKSKVNSSTHEWPKNYLIYSITKGYSEMKNLDDYSKNANRGDIANYIANIRDVKWE